MRPIDADAAIEELTDRSHQAAKRVGTDSPFWEGLVIARRIVNNLPTVQPEPHYDEWCTSCKEYDHERHCCPRWNHAIRTTLQDVQPELKWIPVSERLPETNDPVLTTYIINGDRSRKYVEESSYYENDEYWCSPWDNYRKEGTRIEVIAWMPEPEAYKPNKKQSGKEGV